MEARLARHRLVRRGDESSSIQPAERPKTFSCSLRTLEVPSSELRFLDCWFYVGFEWRHCC